MKPEYIKNDYNDEKYVYAICQCPLPTCYAIKFPKILDGKVHEYSCVCEDCGTKVTVIAKSYGFLGPDDLGNIGINGPDD